MKLFTKYNRLNLTATVLIFLLTSIAYYFLLRYVIIKQLDENLEIEKEEIQTYVTKYHQLPEVIPVKDQNIQFSKSNNYSNSRFRTTLSYDSLEHEAGEFRQLSFSVKLSNNDVYLAVVGKSMEGTESLIKSIILITLSTIILILLTSVIINRLVLARLWQPFYSTLRSLKDFKVGNQQALVLPPSEIEEFALMNTIIQLAIDQADQDYLLLKEFTENASHEMQTPLAILRSKLDLIIQEEQFSQSQGNNIHSLYVAIEKLSRLNKSLLLLTKIDNNQFTDTSEINLQETIEKKLLQFNEILRENNLTVKKALYNKTIVMNHDLADILFNNLISNAIKHNIDGGLIYIDLSEQGLFSITNTSSASGLNTEKIFHRFYKGVTNSEHTGLGLSILKQICIVSNFTIRYEYASAVHSFMIQF